MIRHRNQGRDHFLVREARVLLLEPLDFESSLVGDTPKTILFLEASLLLCLRHVSGSEPTSVHTRPSETTIPNSRATCGSRSGSWRRAG